MEEVFRPVELDHYTEPTHCVNLNFQAVFEVAKKKQSQPEKQTT